MAIFEIEKDGEVYEVDAPDEDSAIAAITGESYTETPEPVEQGSGPLHAAKGIGQAGFDILDLPNTVSNFTRTLADKTGQALGFEGGLDLPALTEPYIGSAGKVFGLSPLLGPPVVPKVSELPVAKDIYETVAAPEPGMEGTGWDTARTGVEWAAAAPFNALRGAKYAPDIVAALGAMGGQELANELGWNETGGEVAGGTTALLAALLKGKPPKADVDALEFINKNVDDAGELNRLANEAVDTKTAGTLADVAGDQRLYDVEATLTRTPEYGRLVEDKVADRASQLSEYIRRPFGTAKPGEELASARARVEASRRKIEAAKNQGLREIDQRVGPREPVDELKVAQEQIGADARLRESVKKIEDDLAAAQAKMRSEQGSRAVPDYGNDLSAELKARIAAEPDPYKQNKILREFYGRDGPAFQSVKSQKFEVDQRLANMLKNKFPDGIVGVDDIDDLVGQSIDGKTLMEWRNSPAIAANKTTGSPYGSYRKEVSDYDKQIERLLKDAGIGTKEFRADKAAYPAYRAFDDAVAKAEDASGVFTGKQLARTGRESKRAINEEEGQILGRPVREAETAAEKAKRLAKEQVAAENAAAREQNKLTLAVKNAEKAKTGQAAKRQSRLDKTIISQYADQPETTMNRLLSKPDRADELKRLNDAHVRMGTDAQFKASIRDRLIEDKDLLKTKQRLLDGGVITEAESKYIDDMVAAGEKGNKMREDAIQRFVNGDAKMANSLASSWLASKFIDFTPGANPLVMGGIAKKIFNKALDSKHRGKTLKALESFMLDPEKYLAATKNAKSMEEANRLLLTRLVGAGQAAQILEEDE